MLNIRQFVINVSFVGWIYYFHNILQIEATRDLAVKAIATLLNSYDK